MPELPEVETMCRGIRAVLGGRVAAASRTPCRRRSIKIAPHPGIIERRIRRRKIVQVERWGKKVVLRFDSDDRLVIEPRMTGLVLVDRPPTKEHLRYQITLTGCAVSRLLVWDRRGLGMIYLLSPTQWQNLQQSERLGPDALAVGQEEFRQRFAGSRREIKVALMDQSRVAGIGNLYASEILHSARIHPHLRCNQLTRRQWTMLHAAMVNVLTQAVEHEGSTLADGTYRNALNQSGNYQNCHRVYDREDQRCRRCQRSAIVRVVQAQRSTFFCPTCQRPGKC